MRVRTVEISVGAFVAAGMLGLLFLALEVSGINPSDDEEIYRVSARFDDVAGLRKRAKVSMAGVTIGRVSDIQVDTEFGEAIVTLELNRTIGTITADSGAQILTEGMLGAKYVNLLPGADEEMLEEGSEIDDTQGALILENLVGDFISRIGGGS